MASPFGPGARRGAVRRERRRMLRGNGLREDDLKEVTERVPTIVNVNRMTCTSYLIIIWLKTSTKYFYQSMILYDKILSILNKIYANKINTLLII